MNREEFENIILLPLHKMELELNNTKGAEYAGIQDALQNFKQAADFLGLSPLRVCAVYMFKHFCSLMSYAKNGRSLSDEPLEGRVADLRLYAALFLALAEEDRQ